MKLACHIHTVVKHPMNYLTTLIKLKIPIQLQVMKLDLNCVTSYFKNQCVTEVCTNHSKNQCTGQTDSPVKCISPK